MIDFFRKYNKGIFVTSLILSLIITFVIGVYIGDFSGKIVKLFSAVSNPSYSFSGMGSYSSNKPSSTGDGSEFIIGFFAILFQWVIVFAVHSFWAMFIGISEDLSIIKRQSGIEISKMLAEKPDENLVETYICNVCGRINRKDNRRCSCGCYNYQYDAYIRKLNTKIAFTETVVKNTQPSLEKQKAISSDEEKPISDENNTGEVNEDKTPKTYRCPRCNVPNPIGNDFCEYCGYPNPNLEPAPEVVSEPDPETKPWFCPYCGVKNESDCYFCVGCGKQKPTDN